MSRHAAHVESIDALKAFRAALLKFAETARTALGDCDSELRRVQSWLENEQPTHWQDQVRKRTDAVERAKEAVRMKKLFKNAAGSRPSAVEEEKALALAQRRLEHAQHKLTLTRQHARKLPREIDLYRGGVGRFATDVDCDLPVAAAKLGQMIAALQAYLDLKAPAGLEPAAPADPNPSPATRFSRPDAEALPPAAEDAPPPKGAEPAAEDLDDPTPSP